MHHALKSQLSKIRAGLLASPGWPIWNIFEYFGVDRFSHLGATFRSEVIDCCAPGAKILHATYGKAAKVFTMLILSVRRRASLSGLATFVALNVWQ